MGLFSQRDAQFAEAVSQLAYCNPFLPERIEFERAALGGEFDERQARWNLRPQATDDAPNVNRILRHCKRVLGKARQKRAGGAVMGDAERVLYEDVALFLSYHHFVDGFDRMIAADERGATSRKTAMFETFYADVQHHMTAGGGESMSPDEAAHPFACFFQIRRAFNNIFLFIIGSSAPAVRLRAAVWQSIFTHDIRRYRRVLYSRMGDYTTLVTGPSGTGKELVARAVGLSRYIPFDPKRNEFTADFAGTFFAVNLSAMSPTLIESELFGHKRGAFTGAVADRVGWLEQCPPLGTVFLDEIGELDPTIQVKLLRVLQSRTFSRLGETKERRFDGKIIAATNQDLAEQMRKGVFRKDLFYRLCSDTIVPPGLRERLDADPEEARQLTEFLATRIVGAEEAPAVADEVLRWIDTNLGDGYDWPGNVRELEQCLRNVLIRQAYTPTMARPNAGDGDGDGGALGAVTDGLRRGAFTADELLRQYCTIVYARTGSYEGAARELELDRRTVKAKVDKALLAKLRGTC